MKNTRYEDIERSFNSLPQSKYLLPDGLVYEWFNTALGIYELEIESLNYDDELCEFDKQLTRFQISTLSLLMYTNYLTRELSRAEKLNGISGKDIQMTGADGTKRVLLADLELELKRVSDLLDKQKTYRFN